MWEQTSIISLYSINWLVFITETECVYCAVRTGSLYNIIKGYLNPQHLCSGSVDYSPSSFVSKMLAVGRSTHPHHRQVKEVAGRRGEILKCLSSADYTREHDFGTWKVYCVSNVTFHAEFKYAINIFPSPTVFVQWHFILLICRNFRVFSSDIIIREPIF